MGAPVTHLEIMCPDRAALVRFYGDAFGWTFEHHDDRNYSIFRTSPGGIGGGIGVSPNGAPSVSVYAEVADLGETLLQAQSLGSDSQMGPMDIGGGARIAMFTDPCGNVFGLYQGPTTMTPPPGSGPPVVWFDVFGPDASALIEFYRTLFDWKIDAGHDGYGHVAAEADGIGGGLWTPLPGMPEHGIIGYIAASDIEASLANVERAGGATVSGRQSVGEGIDIALFKDPAGNLNGLTTWGA